MWAVVNFHNTPAGGPVGAPTNPTASADCSTSSAQYTNPAGGGRGPKPTIPTPAAPGSPSCVPRTGLLYYGCYCGPGSSCPGTSLDCTPTDDLDACCQLHDMDYAAGGCTFLDRFNPLSSCYSITAAADARLCDCLIGLSGRFTGDAEDYRIKAMKIFC